MPSNETAPAQVEDRYVLISRLRSDCVAHKLQLVIKDGFKTMSVSLKKFFYLNCNDITESFFYSVKQPA